MAKPGPKPIDTNGRDLILSVIAHMPDGTQNRMRIKVPNASGSVPRSQMNQGLVARGVVSGLRQIFGNIVRIE